MGRVLDLELHQIEQVGAAADELRAGPGHRGDRGPRVRRPLVGEGPHRRISLRDIADRRDDVRIGRAPADIAAHPLADFRVGQLDPRGCDVGGGVAGPTGLHFGEHAHRRADLAGRAIAALEAIALNERRLQGVERLRRSQPFDGHDLVALVHHRERQTGVDPPAVDQHRAGAALAVIAALLGAGQVQMFAQGVQQGGARI